MFSGRGGHLGLHPHRVSPHSDSSRPLESTKNLPELWWKIRLERPPIYPFEGQWMEKPADLEVRARSRVREGHTPRALARKPPPTRETLRNFSRARGSTRRSLPIAPKKGTERGLNFRISLICSDVIGRLQPSKTTIQKTLGTPGVEKSSSP